MSVKEDEFDALEQRVRAIEEEIEKDNIEDAKRDEWIKKYNELAEKHGWTKYGGEPVGGGGGGGGGSDPEPPKPTEGIVKPGGWGASQDAKGWTVTNMRDPTTEFKVVDSSSPPINVATNFTTENNARTYIAWHQWKQRQSEPGPGPGPTPVPTGGEIYPTKPGTQPRTDFKYKRTMTNQSSQKNIPRDTFWMDGWDKMNQECTGIFKIDWSKDDEFDWKLCGGNHSSSNAKAGRCYPIGVETGGGAFLAKEYPEHPKTPKFFNKIKKAPGAPTVGNINHKFIGLKAITYVKNNNLNIECWVDTDPLDASGNAKNGWKKYFTAVDDGSWAGAPYLTNQGVEAGSKGIVYMRIDFVKDKTDAKFMSVREIVPPA